MKKKCVSKISMSTHLSPFCLNLLFQVMNRFERLGVPMMHWLMDVTSFKMKVEHSSIMLQGAVDHIGRFIDVEVA